MKNLFHIGYHKTATTWFQKKFYPLLKNYNQVDRSKIRDFFYENKYQDFSSKKNQIFCDEELSGNIHNGAYLGLLSENIATKISKFENPKVIIFIRNQYDIIVSSYLQYIKEGGNYSFSRYIEHKEFERSNRSSLFSFKHFDYKNLIHKYQSLIGKENVYIYLFEDFITDQELFISSFIKDHNLEIDLNKVDFKKNNNSYSYVSLFFARIINSFSRKNVLYKYYIIHLPFVYEYAREILRRIKIFPVRSRSFLNDEFRQIINKKYSDSNKSIEKEYNLDLDKYNYPL
tara:strand:+ start:329 stop:1189 length:861 start_codon:yes stop_codon:yes gene_type:complete